MFPMLDYRASVLGHQNNWAGWLKIILNKLIHFIRSDIE